MTILWVFVVVVVFVGFAYYCYRQCLVELPIVIVHVCIEHFMPGMLFPSRRINYPYNIYVWNGFIFGMSLSRIYIFILFFSVHFSWWWWDDTLSFEIHSFGFRIYYTGMAWLWAGARDRVENVFIIYRFIVSFCCQIRSPFVPFVRFIAWRFDTQIYFFAFLPFSFSSFLFIIA